MSGLTGPWQRQGGNWAEVCPLRRLARHQGVLTMIFAVACVLLNVVAAPSARADWVPESGAGDPRIRVAPYSNNRMYRLYGYVGYQIDIEFAPGERFEGLAVGDMESIAFKADGRHPCIRPRVPHLRTNLTVLTNLWSYEFDYSVLPRSPDKAVHQVIYALRFTYPSSPAVAVRRVRLRIAADLAHGPAVKRNFGYWYCRSPSVKPERSETTACRPVSNSGHVKLCRRSSCWEPMGVSRS